MTIPINRATPAQVAAFFDRKRKPTSGPKTKPRTVEAAVFERNDGWLVQLPLITQADNANGHRHAKSARACSQIDAVIGMLQAHLRGIDRAAISCITFVRISPGRLDAHDNLRQAFKHVVDATCAWIVRGDDFDASDRKRIGRFDDQLIGTGKIQCHYEQTTHEVRLLQGIQIRLRLGTALPTPTAMP